MERLHLVRRLGELIVAAARTDLELPAIAAELHSLADALGGASAQPALPGVASGPMTQEMPIAARVLLVYEYWKSRTGHAQARLLPERQQCIRARLKHFTPADLCDAVDGCLLSDFHAGSNDRGEKYDWIESIMRNGSTVEKHIARARAARGSAESYMNEEATKIRAALDRAMEAGDVRSANELNRQLATALRRSAATTTG